MKESELRKHATCSLCRQPILASGLPLFYRVTIERFGVDVGAVQRQHGLGMMLGGALAMHMGPDEDMAKPIGEPVVLTVCEPCSINNDWPVAVLADRANERREG